MIVTITIDSWKGCLDSLDAARAIETGLRRVCPDLEARLSPLADGGEGTTCALCTPEERIPCTVTGPLGEPVRAEYGIRPCHRHRCAGNGLGGRTAPGAS